MLTDKKNLIEAARDVLKMGPKFVVIKKGEHGCLMCSDRDTFVLPAFPADRVVDPTGAGDSFAGGMMGYLATQGNFSPATIKRALAFGTVVASYTIADFSLAGLQKHRPRADRRAVARVQAGDEFLMRRDRATDAGRGEPCVRPPT